MSDKGTQADAAAGDEVAALRKTVKVLKRRVSDLQSRRTDAFAIFESMAHLEALVAERTEQLRRAKQVVEQEVERRTLELQRKADELERANTLLREMDRMKTHLLQNVSHELKTPLVSIRGYGELLRYRFAGNLDTAQLEFLDIIIRNADHLNRVVEDLVHASQQAKGVNPFDISSFDVVGLLREVLHELDPMVGKSDVNIQATLPETQVPIQGEQRQLRQMFLNVVSNAIKFCAGCDPHDVAIALTANDTDVVVEIRDTGIGIPKDRIHRIFDRFYQVDPTATRRYGGMGIGLSLVQEVIENHNGTVFVESELGKGTTFKIRLPTAQDTLTDARPRRRKTADNVDVVVVEDQEETAAFYDTALSESGFTVRSFTNPLDALDFFSEGNARVVLLDLSMPRMSGLDLAQELAHIFDNSQRRMPAVVLMTARSPEELGALRLGSYVHTVLYKPFSLDSLRAIFRDLRVAEASHP